MVLPVLISEFGLEKKIGAGDHAGAVCGSQSLADRGFKVMTALVGRIDGAKAGADGEFSKSRCAVFFPGGAVKEVGNGRGLGAWHRFYSYIRHFVDFFLIFSLDIRYNKS